MSVIRFWQKDFEIQLTLDGLQRLLRLAKRLHGDDDLECLVIDQALALYLKAVEWESHPVFRKDSEGEYDQCHLSNYVLGPCGAYPYRRKYYCSWREWRAIKQLLAKSGDNNLSVMFERAIELLEITLDGRFPELYTLDDDFQFKQFKSNELPLDKALI